MTLIELWTEPLRTKPKSRILIEAGSQTKSRAGVVTILQSKTGQYKTIPLTSRLLETLRSKSKVKHLFGDNDNRLVFPSENGTRITDTNLGRAFRNVLKKVKIKGLHFHDLRHTLASRCVQGGIDPYLVHKYLGHKDSRMMQRYSHHPIESLRSGIGILERLNQQKQRQKATAI